MDNTKLSRIVAALSQLEIKGVKRMLKSPFFNTNPRLCQLFDMLLRDKNRKGRQLSKALVIKKIFPDGGCSDGSFRNLVTGLTHIILDYLGMQELDDSPSLKERLTFRALARKGLQQEMEGLYKRFSKKSFATFENDRLKYLESYLFLQEYYHHPNTNRYKIEANMVQKMTMSLERFFLLSKLELLIEQQARQDLLQQKTADFQFTEYLTSIIASLPKEEEPLIQTLFHLFGFYDYYSRNLDTERIKLQKCLTGKLNIALALFLKNENTFPPFERKLTLKTIINQMNRLFRLGDVSFMSRMYKMYKYGLDQGILLYDNSLTEMDFLNIVTSASRTGNSEWARQFIGDKEKYLPGRDRSHTRLLASITVDFDQRKYDKVITELNKYDFRGSILGLRLRFITLKSYIELALQGEGTYLRQTQSFISMFEQYVRRAKLKEENDKATDYINFISIVKVIYDKIQAYYAWHIGDKSFQKALGITMEEVEDQNSEGSITLLELRQIIDSQSIYAKKWLLQKVEFLEQRDSDLD